jgi:hypothetical protein
MERGMDGRVKNVLLSHVCHLSHLFLIGLLNILLGGHGMPNKVNEIRRLEELNKHPGLGY